MKSSRNIKIKKEELLKVYLLKVKVFNSNVVTIYYSGSFSNKPILDFLLGNDDRFINIYFIVLAYQKKKFVSPDFIIMLTYYTRL